MVLHLVVRLQKRLLLQVHFPELGYVGDAVDRWTAVDVETMLEAQAFERDGLFRKFIDVCKIDVAAFGTRA